MEVLGKKEKLNTNISRPFVTAHNIANKKNNNIPLPKWNYLISKWSYLWIISCIAFKIHRAVLVDLTYIFNNNYRLSAAFIYSKEFYF